jgi:L,D-transpeptidase YcbB
MRIPYQFKLAVLAAIFVCAGPASMYVAAGPDEGAPNVIQVPGAPALTAGNDGAASSAQWRSHIWEVMPADLLKNPEPDPVSQAYSLIGWRPFFIDSRFQTNEPAVLLMARLSLLEEEAIEPGPFKRDEIKKSMGKLDSARDALKAADPDFSDRRADLLFSGEPADSPSPSVAQHQDTNTGTPMHEVSAKVQDPAGQALLRDKEQKYGQAFRAAAELDIQLASALVRYALEMNPHCGQEPQKALASEIPMAKFLQDLKPAPSQYDVLTSAYARYRALAQNPQQRYNGPAKVKHGESGGHIRDLQKRLRQEGFYSGPENGIYDSGTQQAVKQFQTAHNLDADGVIGQRTKDWLNVPFSDKAEIIAYSLKAMRQSATRTHTRYVRINIPQFMLEYYRDGKLQTAHRVVVGQAAGKRVKFQGKMIGENNTPQLTSSIEQVIANPRWYVNDRIRLELNAQAGGDPDYFARHGYVQMDSTHPWGQHRMFQQSGPKNALGRVKFEFPNLYAVYMHDTPLKHLFQRSRRDFSHGCIRLDKAVQFADVLLADDHNAYADKFDSLLPSDRPVYIKLAQPVPIVVEYVPAGANGSGEVVFFGDLYGLLKDASGKKS